MTAVVVVILIAGALLGLYLWSKRAPAPGSPEEHALANAAASAGGAETVRRYEGTAAAASYYGAMPGQGAMLVAFADQSAEGYAAVAQRSGERAILEAGAGWRAVVSPAPGGVIALGDPGSVSNPVNWYVGATGWTGGRPPEGHPTYPSASPVLIVPEPYTGRVQDGSTVGTATITRR